MLSPAGPTRIKVRLKGLKAILSWEQERVVQRGLDGGDVLATKWYQLDRQASRP